MKRKVLTLGFGVLFMLFSLGHLFGDLIQTEKEKWKIFYTDLAPVAPVKQWKVPFKTKNRTDIKTIRVISTFGAPRLSYVKGHFHTGIDMIPDQRGNGLIYVFPMESGVVCSVHLGDPHRTVVVKHRLAGGETIYTSYKHLQEIYVVNGQQVTQETRLGRLYTRSEADAQGGRYDHLHLEIRKKFDDYGVASWATMTKADLDLRFLDPLKFVKEKVKLVPIN